MVPAEGCAMRRAGPIAVGTVFGRLSVTADVGIVCGRRKSVCQCICGKQRVFSNRHLWSGATQSCGCLQPDRRTRHGNTKYGIMSSEYSTWKAMIQRCEDPRSAAFMDYGQRGITVCDRWRRSFSLFLQDVGHRPAPHMQLGRIDNDRGYEPSNVRWETPKENSRNRRSTRWITVHGTTLSLAEWSERSGVPASLIRQRIASGWSPDEAVNRPVRRNYAQQT